jgi:hypothetical protein
MRITRKVVTMFEMDEEEVETFYNAVHNHFVELRNWNSDSGDEKPDEEYVTRVEAMDDDAFKAWKAR